MGEGAGGDQESGGGEWQWLTVADGVEEEWREDKVKDSGKRARCGGCG